MNAEKVKIADLSNEQLKELAALEAKLGVTLVAYESAAGSRSD